MSDNQPSVSALAAALRQQSRSNVSENESAETRQKIIAKYRDDISAEEKILESKEDTSWIRQALTMEALIKRVQSASPFPPFGAFAEFCTMSLRIGSDRLEENKRLVNQVIYLATLKALRAFFQEREYSQVQREGFLKSLSTVVNNALSAVLPTADEEVVAADAESNDDIVSNLQAAIGVQLKALGMTPEEPAEQKDRSGLGLHNASVAPIVVVPPKGEAKGPSLTGSGADSKTGSGGETDSLLMQSIKLDDADTHPPLAAPRIGLSHATQASASEEAAGIDVQTVIGVALMIAALAALVVVNILFPPVLLFTAIAASIAYFAGLYAFETSDWWKDLKENDPTTAKILNAIGIGIGVLLVASCPLFLLLWHFGVVSVPAATFGFSAPTEVVVAVTGGMAAVDGAITLKVARSDFKEIATAEAALEEVGSPSVTVTHSSSSSDDTTATATDVVARRFSMEHGEGADFITEAKLKEETDEKNQLLFTPPATSFVPRANQMRQRSTASNCRQAEQVTHHDDEQQPILASGSHSL